LCASAGIKLLSCEFRAAVNFFYAFCFAESEKIHLTFLACELESGGCGARGYVRMQYTILYMQSAMATGWLAGVCG
jgi:hypothetical protein